MNLFLFMEAVSSVALEHPKDHDCDVCKAAHGDRDALVRLLADSLGGDG